MVTRSLQNTARRMALLALLALGLVLILSVTAQPAAAYSSYEHGTALTCDDCHPGGDINIAPTDAECVACHTGGFASRLTTTSRTCFTCHTPGEDMSTVQTAVGCSTGSAGAGCHVGTPHFGSNMTGCTTCHGTVVSATDPGTSAHHNNTVYTAPTCTNAVCHTAAPHAAYVTGAICSTCHVGMGTTTHPTVVAMVAPTLTLKATPVTVKYGFTAILSGMLKNGLNPVVGSTVTLQSKPVGTVDFADVATTTTSVTGGYTFAAVSPTMLTSYRVVATGALVTSTIVRPSLTTVSVKVAPILKIALTKTSFRLGSTEVVKGSVSPARAGGKVTLVIQRKTSSGAWKTMKTVVRTLSLTSTYSYTYKPTARGSYHVRASIAATTQLMAAKTVWKAFAVK